ncbi:S8 family serine peptidase [Streptodolium elevatio]|uniref:S8 family serine peptidase n=1 Tax=Streptodolium elevatio TaxID=3157996 RepID=A0ABV3DWC6_9ACTN
MATGIAALLSLPTQPAGAEDSSSAPAVSVDVRELGAQAEALPNEQPRVTPDATVTLITGDKVTVRMEDGKPSVSVRPAEGRDGIPMHIANDDSGIAVVPHDAVPAIQAGKIDARLFNVTQLVEWGYDDARSSSIPLIGKRPAGVDAKTAPPKGVQKLRTFSDPGNSGFESLKADKAAVDDLWNELVGKVPHGRTTDRSKPLGGEKVDKIWIDAKSKVSLDASRSQVNVGPAWQQGYNGNGVTVAVLDSGYDATHPDLQGVVTAAQDFTSSPTGVQDHLGHGTHVASIIAGTGAASGGKYKGVAPGAKLAVAKVCDDAGDCPDSAVMAGIEWAADLNIKIMNLSLGRPAAPGTDPLTDMVTLHATWAARVMVVAAGNSGSKSRTVEAPGISPAALTVGAIWSGDRVAGFSSRGPSIDNNVKPDIVAPGAGVVAARAAGSTIGYPVDANYIGLDGTSMATPIVAAAAAILVQQHPTWYGWHIKGALTESARDLPSANAFQEGAGLLDIGAAVTRTVVPYHMAPISLPLPHTAGQTGSSSAHFLNGGTQPVTLTFGVEAFTELGAPAPAGLVTVPATTVTTAPGYLGNVAVTAHGDAAPPGMYYARLTGRDANGTVLVSDLVAIDVAAAKPTLTVSALDRSGAPTSGVLQLFSHERGETQYFSIANGALTCSGGPCTIPIGTYSVMALMDERQPAPSGPIVGYNAAFRRLTVTANTALTFDARQMVPIGGSVDTAGAVRTSTRLAALTGVDSFPLLSMVMNRGGGTSPTIDNVRVLPVSTPGMTYLNLSTWSNNTVTTPYRYEVLEARENGVPTNPGVAATKATMAHLDTVYKAQGVAASGAVTHGARYKGIELGSGFYENVQVPHHVDEYLTSNQDTAWKTYYDMNAPGAYTHSMHDKTYSAYPLGTTGVIRGSAVVGPTLPTTVGTRQGEIINFGHTNLPSLLGDGWTGGLGLAIPDPGAEMTLSSGGQVLASAHPYAGMYSMALQVPVSPSTATYTLSASMSRTVPYSLLSTRVRADWTFNSAHTDPATETPLPLFGARPICGLQNMNDYNQVTAGTNLLCWLAFEYQPGVGPTYASVSSGTVQYSTNDGQTWTNLPTITAPSGVTGITIPNPTPGFVSLRISGTDTSGNSVTSTVIRAYQVI